MNLMYLVSTTDKDVKNLMKQHQLPTNLTTMQLLELNTEVTITGQLISYKTKK